MSHKKMRRLPGGKVRRDLFTDLVVWLLFVGALVSMGIAGLVLWMAGVELWKCFR